jgi:hypothetical protein
LEPNVRLHLHTENHNKIKERRQLKAKNEQIIGEKKGVHRSLMQALDIQKFKFQEFHFHPIINFLQSYFCNQKVLQYLSCCETIHPTNKLPTKKPNQDLEIWSTSRQIKLKGTTNEAT